VGGGGKLALEATPTKQDRPKTNWKEGGEDCGERRVRGKGHLYDYFQASREKRKRVLE